MSSVNPFCRARNWASMPRINLQFTYSLEKKRADGDAPGSPRVCFWPNDTEGKVPVLLPHILFLVLLGYCDVAAVGFEFVLRELPEGVVLHAERVIEHRRDVVLSADRPGKSPSARAGDGTGSGTSFLQYPNEALV